ncbi:MAG: chitobiase/beta-hexosaminidase C-terminal domain-containing protein, partial [Verrucomicrobia bacterium]|nr:chitobiase/beta-hexosaminidase C-terminal domain-containing protein [Verrucomicrobiota bacterium]
MKTFVLRFLGLLFGIISFNLCVAQTPPIFNVKSYGATGNGTTVDTTAINNAINAANSAGGGTVTFPPGNYLSVSIHLKSNVTLYLSNNAVILGASSGYDAAESNPYSQYQDYGHSHFHDSLIWGENLANVGLAGPGEINGNGNLTSGNPGSGQGDKALCLVTCTGVTITDITITSAGHFGILADDCTNMLVSGAHILNAYASQHRDAFNLIDSSHCMITNCLIQGSDDSMCLKSDYALGRKIGAIDIHVVNCTILSTQNNATQFGSETVGNFSDVTFSHCVLTGAGKAGIGITSQDGSVIDGVTYDTITMSNCATPIWMKLDLRTTDSPSPTLGAIRNISINNVVAYHSTFDNRAFTSTINGYFSGGSTIVPIQNVVLNNVNVSNVGGQSASANNNYPKNNQDWQPQNFGSWPSYGWYLRYAKNITFTNCQAHFDANDDRAALVADSSTNILIGGFTAEVGSSSPYDLRFTNTDDYDVVNALSTGGSPLRINSQRSISGPSIVPAPEFDPVGGLYAGPISVALNDIVGGASIYFTTDGSEPTTSSTLYTGPIPVSNQTTIKAIAAAGGMTDSAVNTAIYQFTTGSGNPDFSLSASPGSLTIIQGNNGTSTITINPVNGYNNTVSLSASGLPSGVTASFNPSSTTTSSTLTLTASST